jgi:hypothetical protein
MIRPSTCLRAVRCLIALASLAGATGTHAAIAAQSDFSSDAEGWVLSGDTTTSNPTYVAAGGNPGGFVRGIDQTVGGVWYWQAPAKFLGDKSLSFGETLSFDLRMRGSGPLFDSPDVSLAGGGLTLHLDLSPVPQDLAWTTYTVNLDQSDNWRVGTLAGSIATEIDFRQVLGSLNSLRIRGEFITGSDNGDLDNVIMTVVPEPATYALFGLGLGIVAWGLRWRRTDDRA